MPIDGGAGGEYSGTFEGCSTKEKTFRANGLVCCVEADEDEATLYNPDNGRTVRLNASGRRIWAMLALPTTLDEMARRLVATYPHETLEQARRVAGLFVLSLVPDFVTPTSDKPEQLSVHEPSRKPG